MTDTTATTTTRAIRCSLVAGAADAEVHHRIRREVFVTEQAVFPGDDLDALDGEPATLKALGFCDGIAAGTVRLYPTSADGTEWQGDRLAVLAPYRQRHLGGPLVDFAVATAAGRGGHRMTAHIQLPNVRFFEGLGWTAAGPVETYVGLPHQPMAIDVRRRQSERHEHHEDQAHP
jgi:putative N-acetyltransferase (TIGR04045 family)